MIESSPISSDIGINKTGKNTQRSNNNMMEEAEAESSKCSIKSQNIGKPY